MKIKSGFALRQVADSYIVMNLGGENTLGGMITLNETGAFIWKEIEAGKNQEEIAKSICEAYEIDFETALKDVLAFTSKMSQEGIFE